MHKLIEIYLHLSGINTSIGSIIFDIIQNKWLPDGESGVTYIVCAYVCGGQRVRFSGMQIYAVSMQWRLFFLTQLGANA